MSSGIMGLPVSVTREFRADGTESMAGAEMTYSVNGNQLLETVTSMTLDGKTIRIDPSKVPAGSPKGVTETFVLSGDKLTISNTFSGTQTTQTYDRVVGQ